MISVLIPTSNNLKYLKFCIKSIRKNSIFVHEIIPHINEGADGTEEYLISENIAFKKYDEDGCLKKAAELMADECIVGYFSGRIAF